MDFNAGDILKIGKREEYSRSGIPFRLFTVEKIGTMDISKYIENDTKEEPKEAAKPKLTKDAIIELLKENGYDTTAPEMEKVVAHCLKTYNTLDEVNANYPPSPPTLPKKGKKEEKKKGRGAKK